MHRGNFLGSIVISLLFTLLPFIANSTILTTTLSKSEFTFGDEVLFTVSAVVPKGAEIIPPPTEENFGNIIVKKWLKHKTELEKYDSLAFEYIITTYSSENCTIPELSFIQKYNSATDTIMTHSVPLKIKLLFHSSDSTITLKDMKDQQITGKAPLWWLWVLVILAGCSSIIVVTLYIVKRFRKVPPPPPPKPPYEEAIEALGILHGKRYLQQGLIREYVFELSEIFKRYIGRRYEVNAEEFTTEEMIAWLGVSGLSKEHRHSVEWFFRTTDPVKFARYTPDNSTVERFDKEVLNFLENTKPLPEAVKLDLIAHTTLTAESNSSDALKNNEVASAKGENK